MLLMGSGSERNGRTHTFDLRSTPTMNMKNSAVAYYYGSTGLPYH